MRYISVVPSVLFLYIYSVRLVLSYICLLLFTASTLSSYAAVHFCEGELTDIDIFGQAVCDKSHQEKHQNEHKHACCKNDQTEEQESNNDCCETDELNDQHVDISVSEKDPVKIKLIQQAILTVYLYPWLSVNDGDVQDFSFYQPPKLYRDICIDVSCFRI